MRRRDFLAALGTATPFTGVFAQSVAPVRRVGVLTGSKWSGSMFPQIAGPRPEGTHRV